MQNSTLATNYLLYLQNNNDRWHWIRKNSNWSVGISWYRPFDISYIYTKDPYEVKHQLLINKPKTVGFKHCTDLKYFIEYSSYIDDVYGNSDKYNPDKKCKTLIAFDDMLLICLVTKIFINPVQDGVFWGCSRMGHILQWWNLAQLYLT